ncbi:MAG: hypothetical protein K2R98_03125 [Gemmataceae bacterium]|nr:hypothetical protein [Gemmataceae bacterium]
MRRRDWFAVAGLAAAPLLGFGRLSAAEKSGGSCGTAIDFFDTPSAAAKQAVKDQKLVFVLHVSGNFEDPRFT